MGAWSGTHAGAAHPMQQMFLLSKMLVGVTCGCSSLRCVPRGCTDGDDKTRFRELAAAVPLVESGPGAGAGPKPDEAALTCGHVMMGG